MEPQRLLESRGLLEAFRVRDSPFGQVFRCKLPFTSTHAVVRVSDSSALSNLLRRDYAIGKSLSKLDEAFPEYIDLVTSESGETVGIVCKDYRVHSLADSIPTNGFPLPTFFRLAVTITRALKTLHNEGYVHQNVCPANFSFDAETEKVQFVSFVLSGKPKKSTISSHMMKKIMYLVHYMSPEQGGRVSRLVDARSDLYSLGVMFYELLSGIRPFEAATLPKITYQHVAFRPRPLSDIRTDISPQMSRIVDRLLQKDPSERYQSAAALLRDLSTFERSWKETKDTDPNGLQISFELDSQEQERSSHVSERYFGHEKERKRLLEAMGSAARGNEEIVLIRGAPGTGKSCLMEQMNVPILQENGIVLHAKFQKSLPGLSTPNTIRDMLADVVKVVQDLDQEVIARIREALDAVLHHQEQCVLLEACHELRYVMSTSSCLDVVENLGTVQRKMMLIEGFVKFIECIASIAHLMAIFLDDAHNIGQYEADFIGRLIMEDSIPHLLLIIAHEPIEMSKNLVMSPFLKTIEENETIFPIEIDLEVDEEIINHIVADSLQLQTLETARFSKRLIHRTSGNMFLVKQHLQDILRKRKARGVTPSRLSGDDSDILGSINLPQEVLEERVQTIREESPESYYLLKAISCFLPNDFSCTLEVLANVINQDPPEVEKCASDLVDMHFIMHVARSDGDVSYQFDHSRMRDEVMSTMTAAEIRDIQLRIGITLLKSGLDDAMLLSNYFLPHVKFISQMERDPLLPISGDDLRKALVPIFKIAAKVAKNSGEYHVSYERLHWCVTFLPADAWQNGQWRDIAFETYLQTIEMAFVNGKSDVARDLFDTVQRQEISEFETVSLLATLVIGYTLMQKLEQGLKYGIDALKHCGIEVRRDADVGDDDEDFGEIEKFLQTETLENVMDGSTFPTKIVGMGITIMVNMLPLAYFLDPNVFHVLAAKSTLLSIIHGPVEASAYAFAAMGLSLISRRRRARLARTFALAGHKLSKQFRSLSQECRCCVVLAGNVCPWLTNYEEAVHYADRGFDAGVSCGEYQFAGYCHYFRAALTFLKGTSLDELRNVVVKASSFVEKTKNFSILPTIQSLILFIFRMQGRRWTLRSIGSSSRVSDDSFCQDIQSRGDRHALMYYHFLMAWEGVVFGRSDIAVNSISQCMEYADACFAQPIIHHATFLQAYIRARYGSIRDLEQSIQHKVDMKQLAYWSRESESGFEFMQLMVEAETCCRQGEIEKCMRLYEKTIDIAQQHGFRQYEAIAAERLSVISFDNGRDDFGKTCLSRAMSSFTSLGYSEKISSLVRADPDRAISLQRAMNDSPLSGPKLIGDDVDLLSGSEVLTQALEAMGSAPSLDLLIQRCLVVLVESCGADRGCLLMVKGDVPYACGHYIDGKAHLCESLPYNKATRICSTWAIDRVIQKNTPILLGDISKLSTELDEEDFLITTNVKSVLCIPIFMARSLFGVIELTNSLTSDAFDERVFAVATVLSSQAGIALSNMIRIEEVNKTSKRFRLLFDRAPVPMLEEDFESTWQLMESAGLMKMDLRDAYNFLMENPGFVDECINSVVTLHVNEGFLELMEKEKLHPSSDQASLFHNHQREFIGTLMTLLERKPTSVIRMFVKSLDGSNREIFLRILNQIDERQHDYRVLISLVDVTDIKDAKNQRIRAETAEHLQKSFEIFVEDVCHAIRNPLNALMMGLDLMSTSVEGVREMVKQHPDLPDDVKEILETNTSELLEYHSDMLESAKHQIQVLNTTLTSGRERHLADMKGVVLNPEPASLHEVVTSVIRMHRAAFRTRNLGLEFELPERDWIILLDRDRFQEVLINFVSNSLKFMKEGGVKICVKALSETPSNVELFVSISDTGDGMTKEQTKNLFQRFEKGRHSQSTSGLGLHINKMVIEKMGGTLQVRTEVGKGTSFEFSFTVPKTELRTAMKEKTKSEEDCAEISPETTESAKKVHRKKKRSSKHDIRKKLRKLSLSVLVVDDEGINRKFLQRLYRSIAGSDTMAAEATNGLEAVSLCEENDFDLVFMDIRMPELDGLAATRRIRTLEEKQARMPCVIIGISGDASEDDIRVGIESGMTGYLAKPFQIEAILDILQTHMDSLADHSRARKADILVEQAETLNDGGT